MGLIARQSAKAGMVTYAGVALGVVNSLYIYTKMLTVEQLGEITFLHSNVAMLAPLILFGLGSAFVKFYPEVQESNEKKDVLLSLVFGLVIFNSILFMAAALWYRAELFAYVTSGESFLVATSFAIVGMACMQAVIHLSTAVASVKGRIAVPSTLVQIIKVVQPVLVILFFFDVVHFETIIYGLLAYYVILAAIYLRYALSLVSFRFSLKIDKLPVSLKAFLVFALFSVLGSVGGVLTNQVDVLMITNMLGKYETGLYGWSLFFITVIAIPYSLIGAVSTPLISQHWKNNNYLELQKVYKQSSSSLLVISLGLFAAMVAGIDELFDLMPKGDEYRLAKSLVFLLCVAKIIDMATGLNNQIIAMSSSYRVLLLFLLVAVVSNIGFNLLFIPRYGIEGSAFATIISISIYNLLKFLFLKVKYDLNPFSIKSLQIIGVGISIILCVQLIPRTSVPLLNVVLFSGGSAVLYASVMYKMKVSPEINDFVNKQFKRLGILP